MIPTQPLHGDDSTVQENPCGTLERIPVTDGGSRGVREAQSGTALRAGVGLGVEAPAGGVVVLLPAGKTQGERSHARPRTVVWDVSGDGEPGPAVRAVGEGIPEPAVPRVTDLGEARLTRGEVGGNGHRPRSLVAASLDDELERLHALQLFEVHTADPRGTRRFRLHSLDEPVEGLLCGPGLHDDAVRVVSDVAPNPFLLGQSVDPGPETHPLDGSPDPDPSALAQVLSHRRADFWPARLRFRGPIPGPAALRLDAMAHSGPDSRLLSLPTTSPGPAVPMAAHGSSSARFCSRDCWAQQVIGLLVDQSLRIADYAREPLTWQNRGVPVEPRLSPLTAWALRHFA